MFLIRIVWAFIIVVIFGLAFIGIVNYLLKIIKK